MVVTVAFVAEVVADKTNNSMLTDWLAGTPGNIESTDLVEVQFKNTRKGYYHNVNNLVLKKR